MSPPMVDAATANISTVIWGNAYYGVQSGQQGLISAIESALAAQGIDAATANAAQIAAAYNGNQDAVLQADYNAAGVSNPGTIASTLTPLGSTTAASSTPAASLTAKDQSLTGDVGSYCYLFPDDPLCDIWGGGGTGISIGGTTIVEQPVIIEQGISSTDVNAAIDAGLSSVWDAAVGTLDGVLAGIVGAIQAALTGLGNALKAAYAVLSRLAGFILQAIQSMLRAVIAGIIDVLNDIRDLLKDLYNNVLTPLAGAVAGLRQRLLDLYTNFLRPLLIWIQDLRGLLNLLSIFHVKFAQKLDAALTNIEAKITQPLFYLLSYTNALGNWMNLLVTVNYLIQKPVWIASLRAYAGSTANVLVNAMNPPPNPADVAALQQANVQPTAAQAAAGLNQFVSTGTGQTATDVQTYTSYFGEVMKQGI